MPTLDFTNRKSAAELDKLPTPSNADLSALFVGVDNIVFKDGGVYGDKALSDKILLAISHPDKIRSFHNHLKIDENNTGFYCMCPGTYAIELYKDKLLVATIGFHHGNSIRYDKWNGDAALAKSDYLLTFLSEQGFPAPLQDRLEQQRNMEADRVAERKWFEHAPACFSKYRTAINNMDDNYPDFLLADLNIEIPVKNEQIISLLQAFGKTENFWTAYPVYEELPNSILKTFEISEIISAYLCSDRNYKTRKGLGRFLCSFDFKKTRTTYLKNIPMEVIDDLEKCFDNLGEKRGINEIFSLRNQKMKS